MSANTTPTDPDAADAAAAVEVFKALSDPIRITLVELIGKEDQGEACFDALAQQFDMPQSSLSHHLKILVHAGVLNRERRGTFSWYSANNDTLDRAAQLLRPGGLLRLLPNQPTPADPTC